MRGPVIRNEPNRFVDALPGLAWTALLDGTVDSLNRRCYEYTGLGRDEAPAHWWHAAIHEDDRAQVLDRWQSSVASGEPGDMEARLRRFDGAFHCFLLRWCPFAQASGEVAGWCGLAVDIDDRKRDEEAKRAQQDAALKRSEERKAAILDSALDCIVTMDHEGRITEFNPAAEHTFRYRRDDVVGRMLVEVIIPPSLRDAHRRGMTHYLATGEERVLGRRVEMTAVRSDGREFPVELAITRVPSDGPPSFTGYLRDITARKQAEAELRRSEALLAEGQRLSMTGTFVWRLDTDELTFSAELRRIFAFEDNAPVTLERIATRVHPDDLPLVAEKIALARAGGVDHDYEVRLRMPDESVKHLRTYAHPTRHPDGHVEFVGAMQDVTQRHRSEEALAAVRSELAHVARLTTLGALTASIAHEVNQPLSGIITNASTCLRMLDADPPNVDGARETVQRTIRDGNRASDVIARLRVLFGKKSAAMEAVNLNDATREVIALSQTELRSGGVTFRAELADDLPPVTGDRVQLQQVILNLLRNSVDAMRGIDDQPKRLIIRTERDSHDRVRLTVQDTGVGFDPAMEDRLFDAFYTTKPSGMGIGLSVSRSIIENHHGRLWAEGNDGPGARFSFSLPQGKP